jgi:predicted MPP superfamily phosphohydrolase
MTERRSAHRRLVTVLLAAVVAVWAAAAQDLKVPNRPESVKFAVIGDSGSGSRQQAEVAAQMLKVHGAFAFDRVIMLGDDIYGSQGPADLEAKFAVPYKALLDAGVKFYASLGNHDSPNNVQYPPFNMNGERYYSYAVKNVRFFALDSNKVDAQQLKWLENAFKTTHEDWRICYFHHPLYSDGGTHGPEVEVRVLLEPLFVTYGVNVVFSGHDHIYERILPQKGIYYFVAGSGGQLRKGDLIRSKATAAGFDQDQSFVIVEILGDDMSFQAISRTGQTVDSGVIHRPPRPTPQLDARGGSQ